MATRTELLVYQLGLRLFQARELHTPNSLDQSPAIVRFSVVRLRRAVEPLCHIPKLVPAAQAVSGVISGWIETPRYYHALRCTESWQYDDLMAQHRQELAVIQEEVRIAVAGLSAGKQLAEWLVLGATILSIEDSREQEGIHLCLAGLGLSRNAVLPDGDLSEAELNIELRESYFHSLEEEKGWRRQYELWDIAELGLQRLWENVEEEPEQAQTEAQAVEQREQPDVDVPPDGPGREGTFNYKGRIVTRIERKPWLLLKLAWEGHPKPVDFAVVGEEIWGDDLLAATIIRTAASKANRSLAEAEVPVTIHVQKEQLFLDIGR